MNRLHRLILVVACAAGAAIPAAGQQMSETFNFLKGVRDRDAAAVEAIISSPSSAIINVRDRATGEGALHIVTRRRDLEWLAFLLGRRARPDVQAGDGTTPLGIAAQIGWLEGAEQLLARRASVDLANNRGETPLILAVQSRQLQMVRYLLSRGANRDRQDSSAGFSALDYARQDTRNPELLRIFEDQPARPSRPAIGPSAN